MQDIRPLCALHCILASRQDLQLTFPSKQWHFVSCSGRVRCWRWWGAKAFNFLRWLALSAGLLCIRKAVDLRFLLLRRGKLTILGQLKISVPFYEWSESKSALALLEESFILRRDKTPLIVVWMEAKWSSELSASEGPPLSQVKRSGLCVRVGVEEEVHVLGPHGVTPPGVSNKAAELQEPALSWTFPWSPPLTICFQRCHWSRLADFCCFQMQPGKYCVWRVWAGACRVVNETASVLCFL